MELRQLRYFVAVAEELHFRRAASRLHMSQPPLSLQIRQLERELGCALLIRNRREVHLTPPGEAFLADARRLLGDLDASVDTARRVAAGREGRLRISFVGSALLSIVPGLVQSFRASRPSVRIDLRERPTEDQVRSVVGGEVDVGFVPLAVEADGLEREVLLSEPMVAALPSRHPLAGVSRVTLRRLARQPLVMFPRAQAPELHDRLLASLTATGAVPTIVQQAPETQTIVGLVAAGLGVSLVQASVQRLQLPGVVYRPVMGAPTVELAAITRSGDRSALVTALLESARSAAR